MTEENDTIDTDKFEGHTPGPWKIEHFPDLDRERESYYDEDLKLIAAAPELLAEVKRLRGLLKANECCTACGKYLGQCNDEDECIRLGGWTMEEAKVTE